MMPQPVYDRWAVSECGVCDREIDAGRDEAIEVHGWQDTHAHGLCCPECAEKLNATRA